MATNAGPPGHHRGADAAPRGQPPRRSRTPNALVRNLLVGVAVVMVLALRVVGALDLGPGATAAGLRAQHVAGFGGDVSQRPQAGAWRATGTTTASRGYLPGRRRGERITRLWTITRPCVARACSFAITRLLADGSEITAPLQLESDGWHARFPDRTQTCDVVAGRTVSWTQHSAFVYRFMRSGRAAEARQVDLSYAPECGYGTQRVEWRASLARDQGNPLGNDGPVPPSGPVNGISGSDMARSIGPVVQARMPEIQLQASKALGRRFDELVAGNAVTCRSREHTPERVGVPFECVVPALGRSDARIWLGVLVTDIEGRCWVAANDAIEEGAGPPQRYDDEAVRWVLDHRPLRGCA